MEASQQVVHVVWSSHWETVSCLVLRLLVECRYLPGTVLTVSYMVKTPTIGSAVPTQGVFGVQLRIAKGRLFISTRTSAD